MRPHASRIEPLETRIAPALLVNGANLLGGADNPSVGETSLGEDNVQVVKVTGGMALVWWNAASEEILGISVSDGARLEIVGDVLGDIVGNLTSDGRLSDSDGNPLNGEDGGVLLPNRIAGIKTMPIGGETGSVANIITGGSISNVDITGTINGIYAGDGVFRAESTLAIPVGLDVWVPVAVGADINPIELGMQVTYDLFLSTAVSESGVSIFSVNVDTGDNLEVFSGNGTTDPLGPGGAGGNISNVTIKKAVASNPGPSYEILAGDGGDGVSGGAGGSINRVIEFSSTESVVIRSGTGGDGTTGNGGGGGDIVWVDSQGDQAVYTVQAGAGGDGSAGGNGGGISFVSFAGRNPTNGLIFAGDFDGDGNDDVLVVDSGSGDMAIDRNVGGSSTFVPIIQDDGNPLTIDDAFIPATGDSPVAVQIADVDADGNLDILVAYANSEQVGIFLNAGGGQFLAAATAFDTGLPPADIVVGNFIGSSDLDVAILAPRANDTILLIGEGDGLGGFVTSEFYYSIPKINAVDMIGANIDGNGVTDLFIGFANGEIMPLRGTGSESSLFTAGASVLTEATISNLDVDEHTTPDLEIVRTLLAFSSPGRKISLYDYSSGSLFAMEGAPVLDSIVGTPLVARFVPDTTEDQFPIAVLSSSGRGGQIDLFDYASEALGYVSAQTVVSSLPLKNFAVVDGGTNAGLAALGGSLNVFQFTRGFGSFDQVDLPFSGKSVNVASGNGGDGLGTGSGGNGGKINGLNIESTDITVSTGDGGDSAAAKGGNGGTFSNPSSMSTASGGQLPPQLLGEQILAVTIGDGGNGTAGGASGGSGGDLNGLDATLLEGNLLIGTGNGGDGAGGSAGNGGSANGLTLTTENGGLLLDLGEGGNTATGKSAGNGGNGTNITYSLDLLDDTTDPLGASYSIAFAAGNGGMTAGTGTGGKGGNFSNLKVSIDPSDDVGIGDSTTYLTIAAGNGGDGGTGGVGGSFTSSTVTVVNDQVVVDPLLGGIAVFENFVVADVRAGNGGAGSVGAGGAGGSVTNFKPKGISSVDPDAVLIPDAALLVNAGGGGDGATSGGKGGSVSGLKSTNSLGPDGEIVKTVMLYSAAISSGAGGAGGTKDGGNGGDILNSEIAVKETVTAVTGDGGDTVTGKGGAGGKISNTTLASAMGNIVAAIDPLILTDISGGVITGFSVLAKTGTGGDGGKAGGAGGDMSTLYLDSPQDDDLFGAFVVAGDGGDATAAGGKGGNGGKISNLRFDKGLNSSLALVEAGDGGDSAAGTAGKGGDVNGIRNAGLIGRPVDGIGNLGVFVGDVAQGVFSGRAGTGLVAAINGAVTGVTARQIAAIAASVDAAGTFGVASKVTGIKTDLIGFETVRNNLFESTVPGASPSLARPIDGFLMAATTNVVTRPGFSFTA